MLAETVYFWKNFNNKNKVENINIDSIKKLSNFKYEIASLKLNYIEIEKSNLNPPDYNIIDNYTNSYKDTFNDFSIANQDNEIIDYISKPPLVITIKNTKLSLLNGLPLFSGISILFVILLWLIIFSFLPRTSLIPINELAMALSNSPDIYGRSGGNVSTMDDLLLASLRYGGLDVDNKFLSEMKLTTSMGIERQREIMHSLISKIQESSENRTFIEFNKNISDLTRNREESLKDKEINESDIKDTVNKAIELSRTPLSLPDYSQYKMEIMPNDLDFSIKNRIFTIDDFEPAIRKLQEKIDSWYIQTERSFFPSFEKEYEISEAHQNRFLSFIDRLDPVKIFEAFNFQYQNYPYLLDRIIRDDMPVIYTAVSVDIKELGIWSSDGIGLFYDISSFDVFLQTFLHELTHDIVQRAYGTPIILEGITEMLAINLMAYLNGEGFSNYKGPASVSQYLYNRNPQALIDYYIGRRKDDRGREIDLFSSEYITRSFLIRGVENTLIDRNTELIGSMMDIPFDEFLRVNRNIIPLNEIILNHPKYTPLVFQAHFTYEGLVNSALRINKSIDNLEFLLLPRLKEDYIDKNKKIDIYTIFSIGNIFDFIENNGNLFQSEIDRLNRLKSLFDRLQQEILDKNLIYEKNQLSDKSKEIYQQQFESTYSDNQYRENIDRYRNEHKSNEKNNIENKSDKSDLSGDSNGSVDIDDTDNSVSDETTEMGDSDRTVREQFSDFIKDDNEEFIKNERIERLNEILEDKSELKGEIEKELGLGKNFIENNLSMLSDREIEQIAEILLKKDLEEFSNKMMDDNVNLEQIIEYYEELGNKWGYNLINEIITNSSEIIKRINTDNISSISKFSDDISLLKKRFDEMIKAVKNKEISSDFYSDLNDDMWFKLLASINSDDYTLKYYELVFELLSDPNSNIDVNSALLNIKRIVSYINTIEMVDRYKNDLKELINSIPKNILGIKRLGEFSRFMRGTLLSYVRHDILLYLREYLINYIENYPRRQFVEIFTSDIVYSLENYDLYNILEKSLDFNIDLDIIVNTILKYENLYKEVPLINLSNKFVNLYSKQIYNIIQKNNINNVLYLIYNSEKILINIFGKNDINFLKNGEIQNFYNESLKTFQKILKNFPHKNNIMEYINRLNNKEKYIAYYNLLTYLDNRSRIDSIDYFRKMYSGVFLKQLNLYENYSYDFFKFLLEMGNTDEYSNNLYSLLENNIDSFYLTQNVLWNPDRTIIDYIYLIEDNNYKKELTQKIIDFIYTYLNNYDRYMNNNYFDNIDIFFNIVSLLSDYISKESYEKLIKIRHKIKSDSLGKIPYEIELTYIIFNMLVNYNDFVENGLNNEIREIIGDVGKINYNNLIGDDLGLLNLFVEQIKKIQTNQQLGNNIYLSIYNKSKILYYQSNIVGMLIEIYNNYYNNYNNINIIVQLTNILGIYFSDYSRDIIFYNKLNNNIEFNKVLRNRFTYDRYQPINIISNNKSILEEVENYLLQNIENTFESFYLLAFENWFWSYILKSREQKDEAVLLLSENTSNYETKLSDNFIIKYFENIFLKSNNTSKYKNLLDKFINKRDIMLPFFISRSEELKKLFEMSFEKKNSDIATFLFRLISGNYFYVNVFNDFFVEGELVRAFLRKLFVENYENFGKLFYMLPFEPITNNNGNEEELRRNMINIHYHLFQTLPPKEFLYNLMEIYKYNLKKLINELNTENFNRQYNRIEEEFSKISNLVYLINEDEFKWEIADMVYPFVEKYVNIRKDNKDYIFANYVKNNVKNKNPQIKWNLLNYIKSDIFNYKMEISSLYEKLFYNIDINILISYKDYLTELLNKGREMPITEYRVLLEIIEKEIYQDEKYYGLNIMENNYNRIYSSAKDSKFIRKTVQEEEIRKLISNLKNIIAYSSRENLEEIKENINNYSKKVTDLFRNLIDDSKPSQFNLNMNNIRNIRLLVSKMSRELIKLPIQDKVGVFVIFTNILLNYDMVNNVEYKYYSTIVEYLMKNIFSEALPQHYIMLTNTMEDIAMLIVYLYDLVTDEYYKNKEIQYKFETLLVMYSHYINFIKLPKDGDYLNNYIIKLYNENLNSISKEEQAIIATNLLKINNYNARIYVNNYLKTPIFRRYLEEINNIDRNIIYSGTQDYINWLAEIKLDYNNPLSNQYLIEILGIRGYTESLKNEGKSNIEIATEILRRRNQFISRIVSFFTETYGYLFNDPALKYYKYY